MDDNDASEPREKKVKLDFSELESAMARGKYKVIYPARPINYKEFIGEVKPKDSELINKSVEAIANGIVSSMHDLIEPDNYKKYISTVLHDIFSIKPGEYSGPPSITYAIDTPQSYVEKNLTDLIKQDDPDNTNALLAKKIRNILVRRPYNYILVKNNTPGDENTTRHIYRFNRYKNEAQLEVRVNNGKESPSFLRLYFVVKELKKPKPLEQAPEDIQPRITSNQSLLFKFDGN